MKEKLNLYFRFNSVKNWFNDNYFICLYDKQDNYITSFENIEESARFFNKTIKFILYRLRNNLGIEYNKHRCKLVCFKKEDEIDYIESRGRSL